MQDLLTLIDGGIEPAITVLSGRLRSRPGDTSTRTLLFELLCLAGNFDRASQQLSVLKEAGPAQEVAVGQYQALIQCEQQRRRVFSGRAKPEVSPGMQGLADFHCEAALAVHSGDSTAALSVLESASERWLLPAGNAGPDSFSEVRDCDDLIAPFLEVFYKGAYRWVAWWEIELLQVGAPKFLRDLMWLPANIKFADGALAQVFLPALYPGSDSGPDELKMGKRTVWTEGDITLGRGQKMLSLDDVERDLRGISELKIMGSENGGSGAIDN